MRLSVYVLYLLLFIGLFLGDGKQSVIEAYGASVILVSLLFYRVSGGEIQSLSPSLAWPWTALGLAAIVSTFFSDSIGFSISWLVRYSCGYLIFRLFCSLSSSMTRKAFVASSVFFVGAAALVSGLLWALPRFRALLSSMSLVDMRHGHSHLADLLVFVLPMVAHGGAKNPLSFKSVMSLIIYSCALVLTRARGAWVVTGGFWAFYYHRIGVLMALVLIIVGGFYQLQTKRENPFESRFEYWRQAVVATIERPLLGHGPGTFSIISKRLQSEPGKASWFAHSLPLQMGSELGFVGLGAFVWLMAAIATNVLHKLNTEQKDRAVIKQLVWSAVMIFGYALVEFILDYHITWLLFWATLGLLVGVKPPSTKMRHSQRASIAIPIIFIAVYYITWITSGALIIVGNNHINAFRVAPFDSISAMAALGRVSLEAVDERVVTLALFFHKKNSSMLKAASRTKVIKNESQYEDLMLQAIQNDPWNNVYMEEFSEWALDKDRKDGLRRLMKTMTNSSGVDGMWNTIAPCFNHDALLWPKKTMADNYRAKVLYFAGLCLIKKGYHDEARDLMKRAVDMKSNWSNIYIDYAALLNWKYMESVEAQHIMNRCKKNEFAKQHCEDVRKELPLTSVTDSTVFFSPIDK